MPGARPADARAVVIAAGQRPGSPAARACGRGPHDRGVAGLADRPGWPPGQYREVTLAAGAGHARPLVTGVAAAADRRAGVHPAAGAYPAAAGAGLVRSPVAVVAQVRLAAAGSGGDRAGPAAAPAGPAGPPVPAVARVAPGSLAVDQRGGRGRAAGHAGVHRALAARRAQRAAAGQAHRGAPGPAALTALLDDQRIRAVAAAADPALGSPGHEHHPGGAAPGARCLPRPCGAGVADPPPGP